MELNLEQLDRYQRELDEAVEAMEVAKRRVEFLKLQKKNTRNYVVAAKKSLLVRQLQAGYPKDQLEIMPAACGLYTTFRCTLMGYSLYREVPETMGMQLVEESSFEQGGVTITTQLWRHPEYRGTHHYVVYRNI